MDGGSILDHGPHIDLMSRNEHYSSLIHTFLHEEDKEKKGKDVEADPEPLIEGYIDANSSFL